MIVTSLDPSKLTDPVDAPAIFIVRALASLVAVAALPVVEIVVVPVSIDPGTAVIGIVISAVPSEL